MIEWIITSCVLILVIVALRYVLKGKISLRLQYALWGLVLIRLLVPFSIGNSSISVLNVTDNVAKQLEWQVPEEAVGTGNMSASEEVENKVEVIDSGKADTESVIKHDNIKTSENIKIPVHDYESAYKEIIDRYESEGVDTSKLEQSKIEEIEKEALELAGSSKVDSVVTEILGESVTVIDGTVMEGLPIEELNEDRITFAEVEAIVKDIVLYVWVAGMVLTGIYILVVNIRFSLLLRKNRKLLGGTEEYSLPVYITEYVDTPCMHGIFKPAIYVTPEALKSAQVLKHVLEHESTHYRHGDHIWCMFRGIVLVIHWYNPFVWLAAVLSRNDSELACDEGTIKRIGEAERAEYGRTLIGMTCQKKSALFVNATTMTGSKKSIRERIVLIAKKPKMAIYTLVAVVVIAAVAVGCTFTGAGRDYTTVQGNEENSGDEQKTTTPVDEQTTSEDEQPTLEDEPPTSGGNEEETTEDAEENGETEGVIGSVTWKLEGDTITFSGTGKIEEGSWTAQKFKHVIIEDGITELDWFAFGHNENIESLIIPGSVETAVGFADCKNLKSITLGEGIKRIEECAFEKCAIEKIVIPDSVTSIGGNAFVMCENLKEIEYSGTLESCGDFVFVGTPWLESKQKENPIVILGDVIVDATKATGEVVIPEGVIRIGDYVFCESEGVTSVIMPESLKDIGWRAFYGVNTLKEVSFKGAVETVADEAFLGCGLTELVFLEGLVSIGYEAFAGCNLLEKVVLPESLKEIGTRAFLGCDNLKEVVISDNFIGFGGDVFLGTAWLEAMKKENPIVVVNGVLIDAKDVEGSLVIPEDVTRIASYACYESKYITDVIIPEGVTHIDSCAFSGCHLLASVTIPESVTYIDEHTAFNAYKKPIVIFGKKGSYTEEYVKNYYLEGELTFKAVLDYTWRLEKDTVIISGTGKLEEGTWRNAVFKHVIIEEGIQEIGAFAFNDCEKVESVIIPSTVKNVIGFAGCKNLKSVTLTEGIEIIDECAFERCSSLERIVIPASVKEIGIWAFAGCTALEEVILEGSTVTNTIAFEGTPWLEKSQKENPLVILGNVLVDASKATGAVVIPEGVEVIGEFAFSGSEENIGVTSIVFPKSLKSIGWRAFYGNDTLEKVTFLGSVETIDTDAFVDCDSLKEIIFPEGLVSIGTEAFLSCNSLEKVVFPKSIESIGVRAFEQCTSLREVVIPENFKGFGGNDFLNTEWLANKQKENPVVVVNGVLIDAYKASGTVIIPEGVTRIAAYAGSNASKITDLVIPESVTDINECAFDTCIALKSITIPDSVTNIDGLAFDYCNNLRVIYGKEGSYAEAYAQELGVLFKTIDDEKTSSLENGIYELYMSSDGVNITLVTKEKRYDTYTIMYDEVKRETVATNELIKLKEYKWTQAETIDVKDSKYWLEITPCEGSGCITVYQGGAGMICYDDGKSVTYWIAEGNGAWESYAEDVHRVYDVNNVLAIENTPFYFEGNAEEAATYFVNTLYGERLMNLAPDNAYSIADYEVESWAMSKVSKTDSKVRGSFYYAFSYEGASDYSTEGGAFYGNGKYEGKYLVRKIFVIEKQADNYWSFWFEYMLG